MRITLHPLFIALGIASALFGGLPIYLIYALTALLHECGHIFYAAKLNFRCEKISLMPYGAAAMCDTEGIRARDEIALALSGPAVNLLLCVFFAGLWWFYPQTYAYTDTAFRANAVMLAINLLPAYPLDGGKVFGAFLRLFLTDRKVKLILRGVSVALFAAAALIFFLAYSNLSLLIFGIFLLFSAFSKDRALNFLGYRAKKLKRGREMRYVILTEQSTFKDALRFVDSGKYCVFKYFSDGNVDEIYEEELFELLQTHGLYDTVFGK